MTQSGGRVCFFRLVSGPLGVIFITGLGLPFVSLRVRVFRHRAMSAYGGLRWAWITGGEPLWLAWWLGC